MPSLISNIAADILCEIFLVFLETHRFKGRISSSCFRCNREDFKDGAIIVTHVCKRWRLVALSYAPLWTFILADIFTLDQTKEYILRSKMMKLTVYMSIEEDWYSSLDDVEGEASALHLISKHIDRVEKLTISSFCLIGALHKYPGFLSSAISLRSLTLETDKQELLSATNIQDVLLKHPLHPEETLEALPLLTDVSFLSVVPDPKMTWLDTLTSLWLHNIDMDVKDLFEVLTRCAPHLEALALSAIIIGSTSSNNEEVVDLKSLREVVLWANIGVYSSVLPHLRFPKDIGWRITDILHRHEDPIKAMVEQMEVLPTPLISNNAYLKVEIAPLEKRLQFILTDTSVNSPTSGKEQGFEMHSTGETWHLVFKEFLNQLPRMLPAKLECLHLQFMGCSAQILNELSIEMEFVKPILLHASNVRAVHFSLKSFANGDYMEMQCKIMSALCSLQPELAEEKLWPKAHTLGLKDFDFSFVNSTSQKTSDRFWDLLLEFLGYWKSLGKKLTVHRPRNLTSCAIVKIREVAGSFFLC